MSKEWFIEAHEREVADYLDRHPNATWEQAYDRTADRAYGRMTDEMADAADAIRTRTKEGLRTTPSTEGTGGANNASGRNS